MALHLRDVALRPGGEPAPDDLVEQVEIVAANAKAAAQVLGATPEDIVIARCSHDRR